MEYESFGSDPAKPYYVARLRVRDIRRRGMTMLQTGDPGHYVIPEVNITQKKNKDTKSTVVAFMEHLTFCCDLVGPYPEVNRVTLP